MKSTPKKAKHFFIKEEKHPFVPGRSVFRVYYADGTPLYMGEETLEEVAKKLQLSEMISSITVVLMNGEVKGYTDPKRIWQTEEERLREENKKLRALLETIEISLDLVISEDEDAQKQCSDLAYTIRVELANIGA